MLISTILDPQSPRGFHLHDMTNVDEHLSTCARIARKAPSGAARLWISH